MNKSHIQEFQSSLSQYSNLGSKEFDALLKLFKLIKYENKAHIVYPTEDNNNVFFIISGLTRYYYLTDDGKEWNRAFLSEGMMSTSFSKNSGRVAPYGIQAVEDTIILLADFSNFQSLFDDNPMIERLHRKLIESILNQKNESRTEFFTKRRKNALYRFC